MSGIRADNPTVSIAVKRRSIISQYMTETQIRDLADRHFVEFISFILMVHSGLTPEEVAGIKITDVHLKAPARIKLSADTCVLVNSEVLPMLANYIKRDQPAVYLFHDKNNGKLPSGYFRRIRREGMKSMKD